MEEEYESGDLFDNREEESSVNEEIVEI